MSVKNAMDMAVEMKALSKIYSSKGTDFTAVKNVNLGIRKGEVFGFLGANGAGKTTSIKMMCGLVTPTTGHILLNGHDVVRERAAAMRQIGVVLEGSRNIYWPLSAWQNLTYFGRLKGCSGKKIKERGEQLFCELEMWDRRNELVRNFSRGMQQRVAIACALIADPPILILDEPTLGLDVEATRIMKRILNRLAREYKKTVMITSHQLDVVQELCERVAIMHHGRIITDKSLQELLMLFRQDYYQITLKGCFNGYDRAQLHDFIITEDNGKTLLTGKISCHTILYQLLEQFRKLGMPLISAAPLEINLEDVFLKLLEKEGGVRNHGDL